jgi:hypothetical protein
MNGSSASSVQAELAGQAFPNRELVNKLVFSILVYVKSITYNN